MIESLETEVLVLGSGIAGATAALDLADRGIHVLVVTRATDPQESNTLYAQGGIIYRGVNDSPAALAADIIRAGDGHCNPLAVNTLSEEGPQRVEEVLLKRVNVQFDRASDGQLSLVREGGHSLHRILHVADYTGKAIEVALVQALRAHPERDAVGRSHRGGPADPGPPCAGSPRGLRTAFVPPAPICLNRRLALSNGVWRVRRSWPPVAWGKSFCAPATRSAHGGTASPWLRTPARG